MAERSRVNSSMAAVMASGGKAGFNFSNAVRNGNDHLPSRSAIELER